MYRLPPFKKDILTIIYTFVIHNRIRGNLHIYIEHIAHDSDLAQVSGLSELILSIQRLYTK